MKNNHSRSQQTPWPLVNSRSMRPFSLAIVAASLVVSNGLAGGAIASTQVSGTNVTLENLPSALFDGLQSPVFSQNSEDIDASDTNADDVGSSNEDVASDADRSTDVSNQRRFSCQYDDGEFVVMYSPESDPDDYYAWATPGEMGGGWTPERRCNAISDRLEDYRPDGLLELQTSIENGYNVVCATTSADSACRIVFTVPESQDPIETRDLVFENLAVANSGQDTQGIRTFQGNASTGNILEQIGSEFGLNLPQRPNSSRSIPALERRSSIDLRPFIDPADGGTGRAL